MYFILEIICCNFSVHLGMDLDNFPSTASSLAHSLSYQFFNFHFHLFHGKYFLGDHFLQSQVFVTLEKIVQLQNSFLGQREYLKMNFFSLRKEKKYFSNFDESLEGNKLTKELTSCIFSIRGHLSHYELLTFRIDYGKNHFSVSLSLCLSPSSPPPST